MVLLSDWWTCPSSLVLQWSVVLMCNILHDQCLPNTVVTLYNMIDDVLAIWSENHNGITIILFLSWSWLNKAQCKKNRKNIYRSNVQVAFELYGHLFMGPFIGHKTTFTKYCLTRWVSKLPGNFEIHWVRQYLVNFMCLAGIVNTGFTSPSQFAQVSGMANCPNFWHWHIISVLDWKQHQYILWVPQNSDLRTHPPHPPLPATPTHPHPHPPLTFTTKLTCVFCELCTFAKVMLCTIACDNWVCWRVYAI